MYVESTVKPDVFWVRKIVNDILFLRVRWDIEEFQRQDIEDGDIQVMYGYEEQEILSPLSFKCPISKMEEIPLSRCSETIKSKIVNFLQDGKLELLVQSKKIAKVDIYGGQRSKYTVNCL
jgi:hypothetical protein